MTDHEFIAINNIKERFGNQEKFWKFDSFQNLWYHVIGRTLNHYVIACFSLTNFPDAMERTIVIEPDELKKYMGEESAEFIEKTMGVEFYI